MRKAQLLAWRVEDQKAWQAARAAMKSQEPFKLVDLLSRPSSTLQVCSGKLDSYMCCQLTRQPACACKDIRLLVLCLVAQQRCELDVMYTNGCCVQLAV